MINLVLRKLFGLCADRRGSVTIMSAVLLPVIIGMVALVAEFGSGLLTRVENQRIADLAAFAGALAYSSSSSTATMNAAITKVAALNGLPSSAVSGSLVTSPTGSGNQAVSVTVSSTKLLLLAPILGTHSGLAIAAGAQAEISTQASGCVLALSGSGTGVTLSGGTSLSAPGCSVSSNTSVTVPCGTTITTKSVSYNSSAAPSQPCSGIQPPSGTASVKVVKKSTTDPIAGNADVASATGRLATVAAYTAPAGPTVTAVTATKNIDFAYNTSSTQAQAIALGCTATWANGTSTWTLTCPSGGTYSINALTVGGGINLNFNTTGTASTVYKFASALTTSATTNFGPGTYTFSGNLVTNGTTVFGAGTFNFGGLLTTNGTTTFGAGTFNMAKGLTLGGGATTTFGAGTVTMGASTVACAGGGTYSICNPGTALTFGGPSTFVLAAGINTSGAALTTLGSGTTNSYVIGAGSTGDAINLTGSAKVLLADAVGTTFKAVGNLNMPGGGMCLGLPAATEHDIKGFLSASGGVVLGSGKYTVTGYVALGATGGGNVTCWGNSVGISGTAVTLTIGGSSNVSCGYYPVTTSSFCIGAGYSSVTLTAPASGTYAKLAVIGPASSSNTTGASFTAGASGTSISGALYFPNGPINMSGGASLGSGAGQCLQIVGSQISLNGGSTAASSCLGSSSGGATTALLVR